ncbi:MAG: phospho-N-acetylmuramoyl-pentapeptide-transferase [Clostridiales bacterium]|nr:phospho-N-acetylmuramoyl-pentapeptide-transferase [Clostridiales bacterium]
MDRFLIAALTAFLLTVVAAPPAIRLLSRLKAGQNILHYVDNHLSKQGTATMGGVIFIITVTAAAFLTMRGSKELAVAAAGVTAAYGLIGFLDDFIKVKFRRNLGLRAYQKILAQIAIAAAIGFFAYNNGYIGSEIYVPFVNIRFDLSWGIIPFVIVIFLAVTNSVNLTDGLDGLAGGVTLVYTAAIGIIVLIVASRLAALGEGGGLLAEYGNLAVFCAAVSGALAGFLIFNSHPARIFMGDTGSLALGGAAASVAIFSGTELIIPIIGIMYVLSSISVIIQVLYFKRTRKRVFLMAPLHHHFELKGVHEAKISAVYMIITAFMSAAAVLMYYLFF